MPNASRFTPIKEYPITLKAAIIFFSTLLACLILLDLMGTDYRFIIPTPVQEMGDTGRGGSFSLPAIHLIKIILLGPIHGTISYIVFNRLLKKATEANNVGSMSVSNKKVQALEIVLLWIIATIMMGHVMHWLFDQANSLYREENGGYNTDGAFLIVYFVDEFLSHAIIHVGFFFLLVFGVYCEMLITPRRKMNWDESFIAIILAIGNVILNGVAALAGESAVILLILSIGAVIIIGFIWRIKKINIMEFPLMFILFIGSIGIIIYDIVHIALVPVMPYYPYIT